MRKILTPSILGVEDKKTLINKLVARGYKQIHYDAMDGQFVSNTSLPLAETLELFKTTNPHVKDVHLMVNNPEPYIKALIGKADYVSFHAEAVSLQIMNELVAKYAKQIKLGIVLNPQTPVSYISHLLDQIDFVVIMSVVAGKGGQPYLPEVEVKVKELAAKNVKVEIDGGMNDETIAHAFEIGASVVVAGSYLLNNFEKIDLIKKYESYTK